MWGRISERILVLLFYAVKERLAGRMSRREDNNNTQESISGAIIYFNGDILSLEKESWLFYVKKGKKVKDDGRKESQVGVFILFTEVRSYSHRSRGSCGEPSEAIQERLKRQEERGINGLATFSLEFQ